MSTGEAKIDTVERREIRVRISNQAGFHLRAAAQFAKRASQFRCNVEVRVGQRRANGKAVMDLLTLGAAAGSEMHITAVGDDAEDALASLRDLVLNNFGEKT